MYILPQYFLGSTGVFFAGGPVWALDWLPFREPDSGSTQYVALSAYRQLAEVGRAGVGLVI